MYLHTDLNDFDNSVLTITFQADENNPIFDIPLHVPITDDAINEADEQDFVVVLNLTDSKNPALTRLPRVSSLCRIIDNDRKRETIRILGSCFCLVYITKRWVFAGRE